MKAWGMNVIRVPLNEHCWLGVNGADGRYSGSNYRTAIVNYVNIIRDEGMVAIVELHWTKSGSGLATGPASMLNTQHSIPAWRSIASTFKDDHGVIFEPHNEPYPDNNALCDYTGGNARG